MGACYLEARREREVGMARERVLIVEDDDETRKILTLVLTNAGFSPDTAENGETALLKIEARVPDLVLLDMVMPGMSGWTFLRRLAERKAPPPVLVVSGHYASPRPLGVLGGLVRGYLSKPFNMARLVQACQSVLSQKDGRPAPSVERRRHRRQALLLGASLLSSDGRVQAVGQVTDLSVTGAQVTVGRSLTLGDALTLAIGLPNEAEPLRVRALVTWSAGTTAGVTFEDLSAEEARRIGAAVQPGGAAS
jgi:DNA-binding response OmpR family regulator